jgi:hypothetical protein
VVAAESLQLQHHGVSFLYGFSSTGPPGVDQAGSIYVVAQTVGHAGEVFRLVPPTSPGGTWNKTALVTLDGTNGGDPNGGLQVSSRNVVYGTTMGLHPVVG